MEKEKMEALREQVMPALQSKKDEFQLLGYEHVTVEQVWDCLFNKKWKKFKQEKRMFEIVNDILSLSINEYMAYITVTSFGEANYLNANEMEGLEELL